MGTKRQANFEWLRIVAMLMIIVLHYLNKGGMLAAYAADRTPANFAAHLTEAFCIVAVNCYVLLSGYFLAESVWKPGRVASLAAQILFYSVLIPAGLICAGVVPARELSIYDWLNYLLPVETEHYWFATSYIILCFFMPFLNSGAKMLDKKNLGRLIWAFLLVFCLSKTFIPMNLPWDKCGYDVFWFVTLYLTGVYIRLYGVPFIDSKIKAALLYIINTLVIFTSFIVLRRLYFATGSLEAFINYGYSYNYLFCYMGAIGLFMAFFAGFNKKSEGKIKKIERARKPIEIISAATFGVYLIHEHIDMRYLWVEWFRCKDFADAPLFVFLGHMIFTVITVYAVCTLIEIARQNILRGFNGQNRRKRD